MLLWCSGFLLFCLVKQKTAYELRISDWSSDVCSSDLPADQVAKAVLLDTEDGYLLAVLPANHRIMLSDLTAEFGRRPQLVEEDRLGFIFNDCDRGAIP